MEKLQVGLEILKILNSHSYEAYIVGGAVRDFLLKEDIADVDITTSAEPHQIAEIFPSVSFEGEEYFSCRITYFGFTFELTSYRQDISYKDHRHPMVQRAQSIEEDLKRRDFTMNALAMDKDGSILDLFGGKEDITNKVIRMIGNPKQRFQEDALRILRAVYFSSKLNFRLDEAILQAFKANDVQFLKEEYIINMMSKIMKAPYSLGLSYIKEHQILKSFPFYQVVCEEAYHYKYQKNCYALFYTLHHFLPANARISKKDRTAAKEIAFWIQNEFNWFALYYGEKAFLEEAIDLYNAVYQRNLTYEEIWRKYEELPIASSKDIPVDWNSISKNKRGMLTKKIEQAILSGKLKNEEQDILNFIENGE